jgi:hypothetical protein
VAPEQMERVQPDFGLSRAVTRMELRRLVIVKVHLDYDSEDSGDFGHGRPAWAAHGEPGYSIECSPALENAAVPPLRLPERGTGGEVDGVKGDAGEENQGAAGQ